jgi:hypothetical protein
MPEVEDITVDAVDEGGGRCRSVFRGARSDRDSPFRKKEVGPEVSNTAKKNCSFSDTSVSKTSVFIGSKRLKVFNTSLILDTAVFPTILQKSRAPKRGLKF